MKIQFIDCEMLCWDASEAPPSQSKDIIQIGIVEVNTEDLKISRSRSYFIRPKNRQFEVSDYCTQLTGITRSKLIDDGHYFPEVMQTIKKEFSPQTKVTYAWGADFNPISKECIEYDCPNPWSESGIWDFGIIWRGVYNHKHKLSLEDALKSVGLKFTGVPHDAERDAYNLAVLHNEMIRKVRE